MDGPSFGKLIPSLQTSDFMAEPVSGLEFLKNGACSEMKCKMEIYITYLQAQVVRALQSFEEKKVIVDKWYRKEGGGGITCVIQDGRVFEKAGVNVSAVVGDANPPMLVAMRSRGKDLPEHLKYSFFAAGISSVIHPVNPYIPTIHFNYRYFELYSADGAVTMWWFGGGIDQTPNYLNEEEHRMFHQVQKDACDKHDPTYYLRFKKWADDYFLNKHRGEHRGIGGTFFDDLDDKPIEDCFNFVVSCGEAVLPGYIPIVVKHKDDPFGQDQRNWQMIRRGKYVEFNLVYDRGTQFGLHTPGARIESILISLPLHARWEYMNEPEPDSEEGKMMKVLRQARDWLG